jgi:hypothetical protein
MPQFLQPNKSTQHRVAGTLFEVALRITKTNSSAAIALYRALLSRCSSAPLPNDDRVSLRNAVRNKFRRSRNLQSPYLLGLSFKAGYEVCEVLPKLT